MAPSFQEAYYASYLRQCCLQNVYLEFLKKPQFSTESHCIFFMLCSALGDLFRGTNPHFPAVPGMSHPIIYGPQERTTSLASPPTPKGNVWEAAGSRQRRSPVGVERERPTSEGRKCFWDHWLPLHLLALTTPFWNPCVFLASWILPV